MWVLYGPLLVGSAREERIGTMTFIGLSIFPPFWVIRTFTVAAWVADAVYERLKLILQVGRQFKFLCTLHEEKGRYPAPSFFTANQI